ncbi:MAG: hypothetical protein Q7U73_12900 [Rubrivivax sp.]|nr:hypothetical protein [Rubrivivax sp.]
MARRLQSSAGVSLIEALVAMAVMGVGTLAVLGAQTTLRFNSDLSKQRSEAVRIAQEQIEQDRAFGDFAGYTNDITEAAPPDVVAANATFAINRAVRDESIDPNGPRMKALRVTVSWADRTGQQQQVSLVSAIHGSPPALAGSLLLPAQVGPVSTPGGRHRGIPPGAVPVPNTTTSSFSPPGAPEGVSWIFNNLTGIISTICNVACVDTNRRYLGGVVRFATGPLPDPLGSFDAGETPQGPDISEAGLLARIGVQVALISPAALSATCYTQTNPAGSARTYDCAVPVDADLTWRGNIQVTGFTSEPTGPQELAESVIDVTAGRYRVCRYTPVRGCHPLVPLPGRSVEDTTIWGFPGSTAHCPAPSPQTVPPTPSRLMRNDDFPLEHAGVREALFNQNFLIRKAADSCPGDGPAAQINTNTWHHQPAS